MFCKTSEKFRKIHEKTTVLQSLCSKVVGPHKCFDECFEAGTWTFTQNSCSCQKEPVRDVFKRGCLQVNARLFFFFKVPGSNFENKMLIVLMSSFRHFFGKNYNFLFLRFVILKNSHFQFFQFTLTLKLT